MGLTRIRAEQISDIDYKQAVRVITVTNITLSGGAPALVDGVSLATNDRVLVKGQDAGAQNGIYQVQTVGAGNNGTWIRSQDGNATGELQAGLIIMVTEGDTYKDTQWKLTTNNPIILDTTPLVFEQNSAFAFGNIYANGTAVLANTVGDTVTFSAGNNIQIVGNAVSKTVTIGVTGISLNSISNGTSNVNVVSSGGNVTVGIGGTSNVAVFGSTGANITGTLGVSGNVTGGNIATAGELKSTGTFLIGTQAFYPQGSDGFSVNENFNAGNSTVTAYHYTSGAGRNAVVFDTAVTGQFTTGFGATGNAAVNKFVQFAEYGNTTWEWRKNVGISAPNINGGTLLANINPDGNLYTLGTITGTGNITGGNLTTSGIVSATGNITTSGALNINSTDGNYNVLNISGTALSAYGSPQTWKFFTNNIALGGAPSFIVFPDSSTQTTAYPGTTSELSLAGNITGGNLISNAAVIATGNITGGNLSGTNIAGTLSTAAQPNITSVGTLTSLSVTGNINSGNVAGTRGVFTNIAGTLETAAQTNITSVGTLTSLSVTGNINSGNVAGTTGTFTNVGGTLTTAAQPNITSVGTLGGLTVTGLSNYTGNIDVVGNINVTGNLNYSNVTDLVVGDPLIYIGANNTGNLYDLGMVVAWNDGTYQHGGWVRDASDGTWKLFGNVIPEPTTTVNFTNANYQPMLAGAISSTGNITSANLVTGGLISASGNITGGNLSGTNIAGTLSTAAQPNITSVGTLTSASISGNVQGGNLRTAGLISATGNITGGNLLTNGLISSTGNITGGNILGNGASLSGINTFSNVTVTGSGSILADSISDTLTFVAGTGISISANTTSDTITIATFSSESIFATGGDMGDVTEAPTASQDLGLVTELVSESYDLGGFFLDGFVGNDNFLVNSINGNILTTNAVISTTGNITGGNVLFGSGVVSGTGNITGGNLNVTGNIVDTGALSIITGSNGNIALEPNGTGIITTSKSLSATGNITVGNLISTGAVYSNFNTNAANTASFNATGGNTKGGAGYLDFLSVNNTSGGATNPYKWLRVDSSGSLQIINSAYSATLLTLTDAGALSVGSTMSSTGFYVNNKQAVNGPAFRAYIAAGQAITSGSQQKVTFGSETFDTNGNFASSRFTPTVEGYYQLNATVRISGTSGTGEIMLTIWKNGSEYARGTNESGTEQGSGWYSMQVSDIAYANGTGDYFEIYIQQTSGGNRDTTAGQNISYFSGSMVRGA